MREVEFGSNKNIFTLSLEGKGLGNGLVGSQEDFDDRRTDGEGNGLSVGGRGRTEKQH